MLYKSIHQSKILIGPKDISYIKKHDMASDNRTADKNCVVLSICSLFDCNQHQIFLNAFSYSSIILRLSDDEKYYKQQTLTNATFRVATFK